MGEAGSQGEMSANRKVKEGTTLEPTVVRALRKALWALGKRVLGITIV
jgi:hypothetical protein